MLDTNAPPLLGALLGEFGLTAWRMLTTTVGLMREYLHALWNDRKIWHQWPILYPVSALAFLAVIALGAWIIYAALTGNLVPLIVVTALWLSLAATGVIVSRLSKDFDP